MSEELEKNEPIETKEKVVAESKGFSIASMVLGIISLVLFCIWYISIPCAIIAIIFAILGKKKGGAGMATAGLVLGIVTLSLLTFFFILGMIGIGMFASEAGSSITEIIREMETY